jgi:hypothetical protein
MPKRERRRKCRHCGELFLPHPSTRHHQHHCSKTECQRARKAKSNRRWRKRNADYFKGAIHCRRVKAWRRKNPGYWRREKRNGGPGRVTVPVGPQPPDTLQAVSVPGPVEQQVNRLNMKVDALQAVSEWQQLTFQGLAVHLTGTALQADLGVVLASWYDRGSRLGVVPQAETAAARAETGGEHETNETTVPSHAPPQETYSGTVQLGGSAPGA